MSYHKKTILQLVTDIDHKKIFLPALQRKFVWERPQITLLFDSLMRNYPFGAFLFWRLHREKASAYVFYEFLGTYDSRDPYNKRKQGAFTHEEIIGVLDGQQRLSSMYLGLLGSHTQKAPYKHWTNPDAFHETWLHLDLLSLPYRETGEGLEEIEDEPYRFAFLTHAEAQEQTRQSRGPDGPITQPVCWFKVGDVLRWPGEQPDFDFKVDQLVAAAVTPEHRNALAEKKRAVRRGLEILHRRICRDELINYFEVTKEDLEDILNIFVRVNSGGTVLSKTDLLFSTIVATWDEGRESIEALEKRLNETGERFVFGNEFIMRASLLLSDAPVAVRVQSFRSDNVAKIRDGWVGIAAALEKTAHLLYEFGFNGTTLTSQNAALPIAYYIYKGGVLDAAAKGELRQYLLRALLLGVFGSSQDQVLGNLRNALREPKSEGAFGLKSPRFEFRSVAKVSLPSGQTLEVTSADIERFLDYTKGFGGFAVLSLLYPQLRFNEVVFHQDHIHPFAGFRKEEFDRWNLEDAVRQEWNERRDRVANLQLLEGRRNQSKSDQSFSRWLGSQSQSEIAAFKTTHYIPPELDLEFASFASFYDCRRELLRKKLAEIFALQAGADSVFS